MPTFRRSFYFGFAYCGDVTGVRGYEVAFQDVARFWSRECVDEYPVDGFDFVLYFLSYFGVFEDGALYRSCVEVGFALCGRVVTGGRFASGAYSWPDRYWEDFFPSGFWIACSEDYRAGWIYAAFRLWAVWLDVELVWG